METNRRMFVLMFISSFALASVVGYVGIASAQNMTAGSNMTSNATMGTRVNDTGIGTATDLENLTGSNTEEFSNSTLGNLMANISEGVSNATGNNSALKNLTTGVIQEMSNITSNIVQNQTVNQTGNSSK